MRFDAITGDPNKDAVFLCSIAISLLSLIPFRRDRWWIAVVIACAPMILAGACLSRGVMISYGLIVAACFLLRRLQWEKHEWWSVLMLGGVLLISSVVMGMMGRIESALGGDASMVHRVLLWEGGLRMLWDYPFGVGEGRSGQVFMALYQYSFHEEVYRTMVSSWLTTVVERGIPFFLLIGLSVGGSLFLLSRVGDSRVEIVGFNMAFVCVTGLFTTTLETWVVFLPLMAHLLLAGWIVYSRDAVENFSGGGWFAGGYVALALLSLLPRESTEVPHLEEGDALVIGSLEDPTLKVRETRWALEKEGYRVRWSESELNWEGEPGCVVVLGNAFHYESLFEAPSEMKSPWKTSKLFFVDASVPPPFKVPMNSTEGFVLFSSERTKSSFSGQWRERWPGVVLTDAGSVRGFLERYLK